MEEGESTLDAARRELSEELEIEVTRVGPVEFSIIDPGSPYRIEFVRASAIGAPRVIEHSRIDWVASTELLTLPLAPSDRAYARHLNAGATR